MKLTKSELTKSDMLNYRQQFYEAEQATQNAEPGYKWQIALRLAIQDICGLAGWEEPYSSSWGTIPLEEADDGN